MAGFIFTGSREMPSINECILLLGTLVVSDEEAKVLRAEAKQLRQAEHLKKRNELEAREETARDKLFKQHTATHHPQYNQMHMMIQHALRESNAKKIENNRRKSIFTEWVEHTLASESFRKKQSEKEGWEVPPRNSTDDTWSDTASEDTVIDRRPGF